MINSRGSEDNFVHRKLEYCSAWDTHALKRRKDKEISRASQRAIFTNGYGNGKQRCCASSFDDQENVIQFQPRQNNWFTTPAKPYKPAQTFAIYSLKLIDLAFYLSHSTLMDSTTLIPYVCSDSRSST